MIVYRLLQYLCCCASPFNLIFCQHIGLLQVMDFSPRVSFLVKYLFIRDFRVIVGLLVAEVEVLAFNSAWITFIVLLHRRVLQQKLDFLLSLSQPFNATLLGLLFFGLYSTW